MKKPYIIIFTALFTATVIALVFGVLKHHEICVLCFTKNFSPEVIRHYIQGFGKWAIFVYIFLYTLNTFTPFVPPIFIMSLAAGAIFGPRLGTVALTLGTFCGTTAAFFTARYVGRSWVEKLLKGKGEKIDKQLSDNGFFYLLPARLVGFPPYGVIDFICGLSKMRYIDFISATMIGAAPWVITQVLLADRFANFNPKDPVLWGLLIIFISMIVVTGKIVKAKQNKREEENAKI